MTKNLLQDIKIKRSPPRVIYKAPEPIREEPEDKVKIKPVRREGGSRYKLWIVASISLVFFLFALSYMFLKVSVTVDPKISEITLNENMSAMKNGGTEALLFDLMVISGEESKTVEAGEEKDALVKARGSVLIYNNWGASSQRLDIDTRLEGSNGKIYKTEKQVIVPGMKGSTPGSVEVGIYGAEAGEAYNSGPLDFKILGFKGTPKYEKFYARSKGEIAGGFIGKTFMIPEAERAAITTELTTALQAKLLKKATDQIPEGLVLFQDAVVLKVDENNIDSVVSDNNPLSVKIKGTLHGFLLNESKLTKKITEKNLSEAQDGEVYLLNIRDLVFSFEGGNGIPFPGTENSAEIQNINFNLKGNTKVVWRVDESKLAADLLGKAKKDFDQILRQYPNINSANLVINPFWKMSFPDTTEDIEVIVNYPKE